MKQLSLYSLLLAATLLSNCSGDDDKISAIDTTRNEEILTSFSNVVASSVYLDLQGKTSQLYSDVQALKANKTTINLAKCQTSWKQAREVWEQSEGHLFGPVSTEEIDPRIDTWPVNFVDLDGQLASGNAFTEEYIDNLEHALKGFHPIEYLLFGKTGNKAPADITDRQMQYLEGLTTNLLKLTTELATAWTPTISGNYIEEVSKAGEGSTAYKTQLAAFEEIVNAMAGICDEVANGKIAEPYEQKDPSLEESPFAGNSIIDFTNNIKGVQNVYLGKFETDGPGLEDLVKVHNLSLDVEMKAKMDAAITSLGNITVPFGRAITEQSVQVENAMTAINELKSTIEDKLLPFVQQHSN